MLGHDYPKYTRLDLKYSTTSGDIQLCPIWKAGTTFLKRLFMMKTMKRYENISNPYTISYMEQFDGVNGFVSNSETIKRFVFVRNPYDRLLSSYVDKLLAPNPVYWRLLGIPAIRYARKNPLRKSLLCGHDLTFGEYAKYVAFVLETNPENGQRRKGPVRIGVRKDLHFVPMTEICKPCHIKYDFVGKMETFSTDSIQLIHKLNLSQTEKILKSNSSSLAIDDAIHDTTYQPFNDEFRTDILNCITTLEALKRSWKKLQIRGIIGKQNFLLSESEAETLTYTEFLQMARHANRVVTNADRQLLKQMYSTHFYSTVESDVMHNLTIIYREDLELFGYDSRRNN